MKTELALVALLLVAGPARAVAPWEKLDNCQLIANPANDGDSFHVRHRGQENIFRLYFVDTPEMANDYPARVAEQAAYFKLGPEETLKLGKTAAHFTAGQLRAPFTVFTRWEDARGNSQLPRHYAFVVVDEKDLAELLVEQGLARVFGEHAIKPNGTSARAEFEKLDRLEREAKRAHRGGWSRPGDPVATTPAKPALPPLPLPPSVTNTTTATEQQYRLSKSGVRHNSKCRYFDSPNNTPCGPDDGRPCRRCGG